MKKKVCFAASSGGHFEQLMMLRPIIDKYDSIIVTEKTDYNASDLERCFYMLQVNRREWGVAFKLLINLVKSLGLYFKFKPDVIITTGVLAMIPLCILGKFIGVKLIYIESFAKISSPTLTGRLLYHFADKFYVQWEEMKKFYPKAECLGGIY